VPTVVRPRAGAAALGWLTAFTDAAAARGQTAADQIARSVLVDLQWRL
jgi:hypothetical protein